MSDLGPTVNSHNEWDPLREVIVGTLEGAAVPSWHHTIAATMPESSFAMMQGRAGMSFPEELLAKGRAELDAFADTLEAEGVRVRRPDPIDFTRPFATPDWFSPGGVYAAMPRDLLLVVGSDIIEAPLSWRCRRFEIHAYRRLLREYFERGGRWTSAPMPRLTDELYDPGWEDRIGTPTGWVTREIEPVFDAADFSRCGRDIFVQRCHTTNQAGIAWLRRHLGHGYRVHELPIDDPHGMHVDATFVPLSPGRVLVNRERLPELPPMFRGWEVIDAPPPTLPSSWPMFMSSAWVSINVLMLDPERVVVERQEEPLIRLLERRGFRCVKVDFRHVMTFGGSFHCVTADVNRAGTLQSYFE
jgi:glycine amidinotransferase